jgi:hypothetical protein
VSLPKGRNSATAITVCNRIAIITLTQGRRAVIDAADLSIVESFNWSAARVKHLWYARRSDGGRPFMHQMIAGIELGKVTDHIDGNGLNNRRLNLRNVTRQQNNLNMHSVSGKSPYRGVRVVHLRYKPANAKLWAAQINGRHLGSFHTEEEAAHAYDAAALVAWGEHAQLNFPPPGHRFLVAHGRDPQGASSLTGGSHA